MDSYFAVTPVFVLKASRTFWNESCSLPPQSDMTLMVLPDAPVPGAFPPDEHAVATRRATSETMAKGRADPNIANPLCGRFRSYCRGSCSLARSGGSPRTGLG